MSISTNGMSTINVDLYLTGFMPVHGANITRRDFTDLPCAWQRVSKVPVRTLLFAVSHHLGSYIIFEVELITARRWSPTENMLRKKCLAHIL